MEGQGLTPTSESPHQLFLMREVHLSSPAPRQTSRDGELLTWGLRECSCADTRVGNQFIPGLSGGQKRRLSLAVLLVRRPALIFLDEPTSGLDAAAAFQIMNFVRELAHDLQIVVIATIHQPAASVFNDFSGALVLSNGRVAYQVRGAPAAQFSITARRTAAGDAAQATPVPPYSKRATHRTQRLSMSRWIHVSSSLRDNHSDCSNPSSTSPPGPTPRSPMPAYRHGRARQSD